MDNSDTSAARLWQAESLVTLLGKMNVDKLPPHESRAVGECQAKAVEDWLSAYIDMQKPSPPGQDRKAPCAPLVC
jgi:hypothetical protein